MDYVLIDCGLIHKYLVNRKDIKKIEGETLYTVKVVKDLSDYKVENIDNKLVLSNGSERLVFKKVSESTSSNNKFVYFLDEFVTPENCSSGNDDHKTLIEEKEIRIFPQYFEDGEFIKDKNYHAKFYWNEFGCWVIDESGGNVFVHNDFIYKAK